MFHSGMVQGKKLFLKMSEEVEICLSFFAWCALVLVEAEVTKSAARISTKPWVILYIIVTCNLALLVSSVSQVRSSSMSVTLFVFRYLLVAYLAAAAGLFQSRTLHVRYKGSIHLNSSQGWVATV